MIRAVAAVAIVTLIAASASRSWLSRAAIRRRTTARHPVVRNQAALAMAGRFRSAWHQRARARHSHAAELADMLDDTARRCSSGLSLSSAFLAAAAAGSAASPDRPDHFGGATTAMRAGSGLDDALCMVTSNDPDVVLAVHVLRLCGSQGGAIAESLDRAAATLRDRQTVHDERVAQAGQARLSAQVLTVVPVAFATWTAATTESVRHFMSSPLGLACTTAGILLNVVGWILMRRAIEVRR